MKDSSFDPDFFRVFDFALRLLDGLSAVEAGVEVSDVVFSDFLVGSLRLDFDRDFLSGASF